MNRPTVHDIAREAGVSLATVDRVLNARPGVREQTIAKVQGAVERLGYVRDTHAANLARQRLYRFAFVLPEGPSQFIGTVRSAIHEARLSQVADRAMVDVVSVPSHDPHAIVRTLQSLDPERLDGVALMAPETPQIRDAVAHLKLAGLVVVALVSDLPNSDRDYFVGVNNVAAGRSAGFLMGRFVAGPADVLILTNSLQSRDSIERRLGFDAVLAEDFPHLTALPSVETFDDAGRVAAAIRTVLAGGSRLGGIYAMGSADGPLLAGLQEACPRERPVVIAHELTDLTRDALLDRRVAAVITQNVGHLVRSALRVLRALSDAMPIFEAQERVRIEIVVRENLP